MGAALLCCARPGPAPVQEPPVPTVPPTPPAPEVQAPPCERVQEIEVRKAERLLIARCEGGARVEIPVALGRGDPEPKRAAGDQRTPKGRYRVSAPPRPSRFHLFVPIDYPSPADAEAAHAEGRLSWGDLERIRVARARGEPPPHDTPLGGNMGFHGEGDRWRGDSADLDWTLGCIAMPDDRIEFLAARVEVGTAVWIRP